MQNKPNKEEKIIEKKIEIVFKIRTFNDLYELDEEEQPIMNKPAYQIDDMMSDIENMLERELGDLLENLNLDVIPEDVEYIDDLVDMNIQLNGKDIKLYKRSDHIASLYR